jgi:UDP-N-acetylmuramoylalanine--D-glutamate ligase
LRFEDYFKSHIGKKIAVCGIGVSNLPLVRILRERCIEVEARDIKTAGELGDVVEELRSLGVGIICGPDYLKDLDADIIYRSPGMRPDLPEFSEAVKNGARLCSEMEAFFEVCPCRTVGITGSDGKTTTSTVIAKMLEKAGHRTWLGGNIGMPLLGCVPDMLPEDIAVLELSSFQLMTIKKSPDIAVITNIAPNHLDVHRDMEEYVESKRNIFRFQGPEGRVVLNLDNTYTRAFTGDACGEVWVFSTHPDELSRSMGGRAGSGDSCPTGENTAAFPEAGQKALANAVYLNGESVMVRTPELLEEILNRNDIKIPGLYNVENYMAAIAAVYGLAGKREITEVARSFGGVEHRNEFVREFEGVRYYNNSIASSPTRTVAALRAFSQKVILIAGGYDKKIPFDPLVEALPGHAKALILLGATKEKIRKAVEDAAKQIGPQAMPPVYDADSLEEAVNTARSISREGDIVCLAPTCASFDMFKNFEERGNAFKKLVNGLS